MDYVPQEDLPKHKADNPIYESQTIQNHKRLDFISRDKINVGEFGYLVAAHFDMICIDAVFEDYGEMHDRWWKSAYPLVDQYGKSAIIAYIHDIEWDDVVYFVAVSKILRIENISLVVSKTTKVSDMIKKYIPDITRFDPQELYDLVTKNN
jgi:hypothetical protein